MLLGFCIMSWAGVSNGKRFFSTMRIAVIFIDRLAVLVAEGALDIYAWVLMPNHFHLLCKTRNRPLSSSMRKILTGYVVNFNRRHLPLWTSISEPVQVDCMPGRQVFKGIGALYSLKFIESRIGQRHGRTEPQPLVRSLGFNG